MKTGKNDRPGYSCERTQWVLVTGAGPLNRCGQENLLGVGNVRPTLVASKNMLEHQMKCKAEFANTEARSRPGGYGGVEK